MIWSQRIKQLYEDFREPNDIDYIWYGKSSKWIEYHQMIPIYKQELSGDDLYTLKVSHTIRKKNFIKHIKDCIFLKNKWCKLTSDLNYLLAYRDWYHWPRIKFNFNQDNESFFKDNVTRKYDHDWLHEATCFWEKPAYEAIKDDLLLADVNLQKFAESNNKDIIAMEEVLVIALERYNNKNAQTAIHLAAEKCITGLYPDQIAIYCVDNYQRLFIWSILIEKFNHYRSKYYETIIDKQ